jgi:hypothetical protein
MDHPIEYADYNSTIDDNIYDYTIDDDTISSENSIVYYVWNNMYDLKHHINHEYINHDDEALVLGQYINIMRFLYEIS